MDVQVVYSPAPGPAGGSSPVLKSTGFIDTGFNSFLDVPIGATLASDDIYVTISVQGAAPGTPPSNFTLIQTFNTGGGVGSHYIYKWDGTGTRPDNTNVTWTFGYSDAAQARSYVISGANGEGNTSEGDGIAASTHTTGTITASANSLLLIVYSYRNDVTFATTGDVDALTEDPVPPVSNGRWVDPRSIDQNMTTAIVEHGGSAGTSIAGTATTGSVAAVKLGLLEILAA